MKYISGGAEAVNPGGGYKLHDYFINNPISVTKSGYIYVFVSNESNLPVYFDNLAITQTPGVILEENSYYPFGLIQKGISSRAMTSTIKNKYKFNGKELQSEEFADGSGLELEDFGARMQDPQIGRWFNQDKFSDVYLSLTQYQYAANNPIKIVDEGGHLLKDKDGNIIATSTGNYINRNENITVNGIEYNYKTRYEVVTIYTDKGTPVNALRQIESEVTKTNEDGSTSKVSGNNSPIGTETNCHGFAFAGGKLVIEDNSDNSSVIKTILKEDGYIVDGLNGGKVSEKNATGFLEMDKGGKTRDIYHSGIKNEDGTWSADHDDLKATMHTSLEQSESPASQNSFVGVNFFTNTDKKHGKAKGLKMVTKQEAKKIRKTKKLNTSDNALDGINYD